MENFYLSKKRFINTDLGKNKNNFFLLPGIIVTKEEKVSWYLTRASVTFVFFNFYAQVNIFNTIKDSGKEIFKQDVANVIRILKEAKFDIKDMNALIKFLQDNIFLILIIKNTNLEHPYCRKVITHHFKNCDFLAES